MRRWSGWGAVACLIVAVGCGGGDGTTTTGKGASTTAKPGGSGGAVAEAVSIDAAVDVSLAKADFVPVGDPVPVEVGDVVRTDDSGFAEVTYHDGSLTRLDVNTDLVVLALTNDKGTSEVRTKMGVGRTWNRARDLTKDDTFEIETSVATATVRGTAFYIQCPNDTTCTFTVLEGTIELELPDGTTIELEAPSQLTVTNDGPQGQPTPIDPTDLLADDNWLTRNTNLDTDAGYPKPDQFATGTTDSKVCTPRLESLLAIIAFIKPSVAGLGFIGNVWTDSAPTASEIAQLPAVIREDMEALGSAFAKLSAAFNSLESSDDEAKYLGRGAAQDAFLAEAGEARTRVLTYFRDECPDFNFGP